MPKPQPGILDIAPYKGGEGAVMGVERVYKLSSNESPLGASPRAKEAYQTLAGELHRYPDGAADALRNGIAKHFGLPAAHIVRSEETRVGKEGGRTGHSRWTPSH